MTTSNTPAPTATPTMRGTDVESEDEPSLDADELESGDERLEGDSCRGAGGQCLDELCVEGGGGGGGDGGVELFVPFPPSEGERDGGVLEEGGGEELESCGGGAEGEGLGGGEAGGGGDSGGGGGGEDAGGGGDDEGGGDVDGEGVVGAGGESDGGEDPEAIGRVPDQNYPQKLLDKPRGSLQTMNDR